MRMFAMAPIVAALGLALAGCASDGVVEDAEALLDRDPRPIVAARQAAFHLSGAAMGNMRAAIDRGDDPKSQAYAARGVARWARALPAAFPAASANVTPSRALPGIWANKPDFELKAAAYAGAATALAAAAASGDKAAFAARHAETLATCKACHDLYQAPARNGR